MLVNRVVSVCLKPYPVIFSGDEQGVFNHRNERKGFYRFHAPILSFGEPGSQKKLVWMLNSRKLIAVIQRSNEAPGMDSIVHPMYSPAN